MSMNRIQFQPGMSLFEFFGQRGTEAQCEAALERARWPQGFRCPRCGGELVVHSRGETKGRHATCWHCGSEVALPGTRRGAENQPERERDSARAPAIDDTVLKTPRTLAQRVLAGLAALGFSATTEQNKDDRFPTVAEMIRAAGGPLPPEKRRECPECGSKVPKQARHCGWCGTRFSVP